MIEKEIRKKTQLNQWRKILGWAAIGWTVLIVVVGAEIFRTKTMSILYLKNFEKTPLIIDKLYLNGVSVREKDSVAPGQDLFLNFYQPKETILLQITLHIDGNATKIFSCKLEHKNRPCLFESTYSGGQLHCPVCEAISD